MAVLTEPVAHAYGLQKDSSADNAQRAQLLEDLQGFCSTRATGQPRRDCQQALRLLMLCALLDAIPAPETHAQLWAAIEPHVTSLQPEQMAELMWANSMLNAVSRECI
jgi:hypothetical protein